MRHRCIVDSATPPLCHWFRGRKRVTKVATCQLISVVLRWWRFHRDRLSESLIPYHGTLVGWTLGRRRQIPAQNGTRLWGRCSSRLARFYAHFSASRRCKTANLFRHTISRTTGDHAEDQSARSASLSKLKAELKQSGSIERQGSIQMQPRTPVCPRCVAAGRRNSIEG